MFLSSASYTVADARYEWINTDAVGALLVIAQKQQAVTSWTKMSNVMTLDNNNYTSYTWVIRNFTVNASTYSYVDNLVFIDLTATFGSGNEPDHMV
jgi:hypothetical protein